MHSMAIDIVIVVGIMAIGGALPLLMPRIRPHLPVVLSASAGIMLGTACLHLLPDAMQLVSHNVGWGVLAGFLFLYLFEQFVTVHVCEAMGCEVHHIGIAALFGLSIHTFVNGVAMGAGALSGIGGLVTFAVAAHKLPEAFSLTSILLHEHYRRSSIALMSLLFMSMIPLGVMAVKTLAVSPESPLTGYALAFSAGTFLHIAVSDLLPEVHKSSHHRLIIVVAFVIGIAATALASY
jgi:zinc and cadmium transporter